MKLTVRETAVFAMLGALMYASKMIMEVVPNVHLLGMFVVAFTVVYRKKALYPKIDDKFLFDSPPSGGVLFGKDIHTGKIIFVGLIEPNELLIAIIVVGIICKDAVFKTINIIILSLNSSLF